MTKIETCKTAETMCNEVAILALAARTECANHFGVLQGGNSSIGDGLIIPAALASIKEKVGQLLDLLSGKAEMESES